MNDFIGKIVLVNTSLLIIRSFSTFTTISYKHDNGHVFV
ncbi:hypothetical protein MTsPCn9_22100 [Croceitalea sp. MTPC9]|nr:hypothetical protein MTsPCn6_24160 [Croceitalea sp. MTPC6]GMN17274.1 hypothetical protein MTsPCn9_22100 [Croceitalea sp. MTPC9]